MGQYIWYTTLLTVTEHVYRVVAIPTVGGYSSMNEAFAGIGFKVVYVML